MPNILTIDWDYFFKASRKIRDSFPPIPDGTVGAIPDNSLWLKHYKDEYEEVSIDSTSLTELIKVFYAGIPQIKFSFFSENHGEMLNVVKFICDSIGDNTPVNITNVDYHHDFSFSGFTPRCDNCGRLIQSDSFEWCSRPDSDRKSFGFPITDYFPVIEVSFGEVIKRLYSGYYQYVHLCRSDLYSPPKEDFLFDNLCVTLVRNSADVLNMEILSDRSDIEAQMTKLYKENQS